MGRITSDVGLVSGLPIADIVDQLIQVASKPRDLLTSRNKDLQSQQVAITTLSAKLVATQFSLAKLAGNSLYNAKKATSSDTSLVTAAVTDSSKLANSTYTFSPVRTATSQQFVSQRFESEQATFSAQSLSFRTGGFVNKGISLEELNAGNGVQLGQLRITDKSGESSVIDLRFATTVDDVLDAINSDATINVAATIEGDSFKLTDNTGQSGTLSVVEIGSGKTAADLGLAGINASGATTSATGDDVYALHKTTRLSQLNDGNGVYFTDDAAEVDDLVFTFADESGPLGLDLSGAATLGDVVDAINNSEELAGKITAAIAADGNRLELTDLTSGAGTFSVSNGVLGSAADDLGLGVAAVDGTITGERLTSGLRDTLLKSLNGGTGIQTFGNLEITNRDGIQSTIDLSGVETLGEFVAAINDQATNVTANVNDNGGGLILKDTSGGSAGNFIVASEAGATIAEDLGISIDDAGTLVDSGGLNRQTLSKASFLSGINGGQGISKLGDIQIIDTKGVSKSIDLNTVGNEAKTVGDIINRINASGVGVEARITDTGEGIILVDTAGGTGTITVKDTSGTVATDLGIVGTSTEADVEGKPTQVIDGTTVNTLNIEDEDTLADVVEKLNALDAGLSASLLYDGHGVRLSITVDKTGSANEQLVDFQNSDFQLKEISHAQDALLQYGSVGTNTGGVLVSSATNSFRNVVSGLNLTIQKSSTSAVNVTVNTNDAGLVSAVQGFVDSYNALRDELATDTSFDQEALTTGLLFGTNEALRVDTQVSRLITDRHFGLGAFQTLAELGVTVDDDGKLEFDEAEFRAAFQKDAASVKSFFGDDEAGGFVSKYDGLVEQLAGADNGLLTLRSDALQSTVDSNAARIDKMDAYLERQREILLNQYAQLESILSNFQATQSALAALTPIAPLSTGTSSGTSSGR